MMVFKTQYDPHDRKYTCNGDPIVKTFTGRYNEFGDLVLVPTGEENLYDKIQAEAAACDMDVILRKFANGDLSVLSERQGITGDFAFVPQHFTEAVNLVQAVEREFDMLPADQREKYGNDWVKYGNALLSPKPAAVAEPANVVKEVVENDA